MAKVTTWANDLVQLIFKATNISNIADNAAGSPITNLYISLHTASPGVGGDQTTNEVAYTNYLRVAVARTAGGWQVVGGVASNVGVVQFPSCGVTGATAVYVGIGTSLTTAGKLLYFGALSGSLAISSGIQPQFGIGALTCTEA